MSGLIDGFAVRCRMAARRSASAPAQRTLHSRAEGEGEAVPALRRLVPPGVGGAPATTAGRPPVTGFVQDAAGRFGWWDFPKPPRSEDELFDLSQVRHLAQRLGLARRSGRKLVLTPRGRARLDDVDQLWRSTARGLLLDHEFAAAVGEVILALLTTRKTTPATEIDALLAEVVHEVGWCSSSTGGAARHQRHQLGMAPDDELVAGPQPGRAGGARAKVRAPDCRCVLADVWKVTVELR